MGWVKVENGKPVLERSEGPKMEDFYKGVCCKSCSVPGKKEHSYQNKKDYVFNKSCLFHLRRRYRFFEPARNNVTKQFLSGTKGADIAAINVAKEYYQKWYSYHQQKCSRQY